MKTKTLTFLLLISISGCSLKKELNFDYEKIDNIDVTFYNINRKINVSEKNFIKDLTINYLNKAKNTKSKFAPIYRFDLNLENNETITISFNRNYLRLNGQKYYIMNKYIDDWVIQFVDSLPRSYLKKLKLNSDTITINDRLKY